jgi:hypothetical protein
LTILSLLKAFPNSMGANINPFEIAPPCYVELYAYSRMKKRLAYRVVQDKVTIAGLIFRDVLYGELSTPWTDIFAIPDWDTYKLYYTKYQAQVDGAALEMQRKTQPETLPLIFYAGSGNQFNLVICRRADKITERDELDADLRYMPINLK